VDEAEEIAFITGRKLGWLVLDIFCTIEPLVLGLVEFGFCTAVTKYE